MSGRMRLVAAGLCTALAEGPAWAGPAGGLTGWQQQRTIERLTLVCENDRSLVCPADPGDPGYCIPGSQGTRIFHVLCNPGLPAGEACSDPGREGNACVPVVLASAEGTLTLDATERREDAGCDPETEECLVDLDVDVAVEIPGDTASASIARRFTLAGFPRRDACQGDDSRPGVRIGDWFPFRNRDCVLDDGINFEGLIVPTNRPVQLPPEVGGPVDSRLRDIEAELLRYAEEEHGLSPALVLPTSMVDVDDPTRLLDESSPGSGTVRAGHTLRVFASELFDPRTSGETRSGRYPVTVRFAARRPSPRFEYQDLTTQGALDVAISTSAAVVARVGGASVYRREAEGWLREAILAPADPACTPGSRVAASEDIVLASASCAAPGATPRAVAFVYRLGRRGWQEEAKLDPSTSESCLADLAVSGDLAVLGAPCTDVAGKVDQGAAYVFRSGVAGWVEEGPPLVASDGAALDEAGRADDVDAGRPLIGAPRHDQQRGAAYLFERAGGGSQQQKLVASDAEPFEYLGSSVSIAGDWIAAGAPLYGDFFAGDANRGSVSLFQRSAGSWQERPPLRGRVVEARFGSALSLSSDLLVVGTAYSGFGPPADIAIYAFRLQDGAWVEEARMHPALPTTQFGQRVAAGTAGLAVASDAGSGDAHAFELPRVELGITGSSSGGSLALTVRGAKIDVAVSGGTPAATAASLIAAAVNAAPISAVIGAPARAVPAPGGAGARVVLHQVREGELEIGSDTTGLSAFVVTDCNDGEDDDLDGIVDLADIGCADATDLSENSPLYPCDDGIDDDGDGSWDTRRFALGDPSCFWLVGDETSECQDGVDNDGEPGTDFDAGVSVRGAANADPNGPDPECGSAIWDDESTGCGLGFELVALAPLLRQLSRRRRRRGVKGGF